MKFQRYVTVLAKISNHNTLFSCKPPNELVVNSGFIKKKKKKLSVETRIHLLKDFELFRELYICFLNYIF